MSNSHGDLFTEIGKLVLAANSGQPIDLGATTKDLAQRYENLGMSEETLTKVVSRAIGAISYSMARTNSGLQERLEALRESQAAPSAPAPSEQEPAAMEESVEAQALAPMATKPAKLSRRARRRAARAAAEASGKSLFPSGVRVAVLT